MKKWLLVSLSLLLLTSLALPSHASYQCLRVDGNGYARILDANQKGLDMEYSDFMIGVRIKLDKTIANQVNTYPSIVHKYGILSGYYFRIYNKSTDTMRFCIADGSIFRFVEFFASSLNDLLPHYLMLVADRSSSTGLKIFLDGSEVSYAVQQDPTSVGDIDSTWNFHLGCNNIGQEEIEAQFDELRIFNFGYGGLPADYEAYITWLSQGRNVFKDISEYNSGSWNHWADADRTNEITNPDFEAGVAGWAAWRCTLVQDDVRKHSGSYSGKATQNYGASSPFIIQQNITTLDPNVYYEILGWMYFPSSNAASASLGIDLHVPTGQRTILTEKKSTTEDEWVFLNMIAKNTLYTGGVARVKSMNGEDGDEFNADDIYLRRVGLVARWRFEGDYTDETSNSNTLTEGGSGNAFPGYTLKKQKIIGPFLIK